MNNDIFRKDALDKLSSPEQLDKMITITSWKNWIVLLAIVLFLAALVYWSIFGTLETTLESKGVVVTSGGVAMINSNCSGQISDIRVRSGDLVKSGDTIARLNQEELISEINRLSDLLKTTDKQSEVYLKLQNQIAAEKEKLRNTSGILSHEYGRVIAVNRELGDWVEKGTPIISISKGYSDNEGYLAVLYMPIESGKTIKSGMVAHISPSTVSKETYGFIEGRVMSVSEYPVSLQGVIQKVGTAELAESFLGDLPKLEVTVELFRDEGTLSGYKWSTKKGPPYTIENDTMCAISIVVDQLKPIEMVIPRLRDLGK